MKIAIDARGANWYAGTGIGTYTSHIVKHMLKLDDMNSYFLYWWGDDYKSLCNDNVSINIASKKHRKFFEEYYIPNSIVKNSIDIYHVPQNGIGLPENKKCICISTLHDLIPYIMPETVGKSYLKKFLSSMPQIIQNSDMIITVSEFSKKDIMRVFNIDEKFIQVTPLAAEEYFKPIDKDYAKKYIKKNYSIDDNFILYVGGFSPRKNVKSILIAFSRIPKNISSKYKIVIIGNSRDEHVYIKTLCETLGISNSVIFTGFVPYEALSYFYNACSVFVYPSLYEGFGLPPLEAMSCGTPVITSNVSSIPEVVGDSAILINPYDTEELKDAIVEVLEDENLRHELSRKGCIQSKRFDWNKTAESTLSIYKNVYNCTK